MGQDWYKIIFQKPLFYENKTTINPDHLKSLEEVYSTLELILTSSQFLAGNRLSIADISAFSTIAVADLFLPIAESYPELERWSKFLRSQEWFEAAARGLAAVQLGLQTKLGPNIVQQI